MLRFEHAQAVEHRVLYRVLTVPQPRQTRFSFSSTSRDPSSNTNWNSKAIIIFAKWPGCGASVRLLC